MTEHKTETTKQLVFKDLQAAFLKCLQSQNECKVNGKPCHPDECGCQHELESWIDGKNG